MEGSGQIAAIMDRLRRNPPGKIGEAEVLRFRDYQEKKIMDMVTGEVFGTGLPKSNVLYFELPNDGWCCARPSGTEPKVKFYYTAVATSESDSRALLDAMIKQMTV